MCQFFYCNHHFCFFTLYPVHFKTSTPILIKVSFPGLNSDSKGLEGEEKILSSHLALPAPSCGLALIKAGEGRGNIPCPLLISQQTFCHWPAVIAPGFCRLLALGSIPGSGRTFQGHPTSFLCLETLGPHSVLSMLYLPSLWANFGVPGHIWDSTPVPLKN